MLRPIISERYYYSPVPVLRDIFIVAVVMLISRNKNLSFCRGGEFLRINIVFNRKFLFVRLHLNFKYVFVLRHND